MGAPSLVSMAQRACARDIQALQDIGDMQWELVEPILRKVTNPYQLHDIEKVSPHILDHSAPLWKAFIARDVPEWEKKIMEPKNPRSWWKVYRKLMRDEQKEKDASEQALMAAMKGLDQKKEANKLNFVNKIIPEPATPRPQFVDGVPRKLIGNIRKPMLKNAKTGREVMDALRKQAVNATRQRNFTVNPTAQRAQPFVRSAKSQITKAPENMVRDYRKPQLTAAARQMTSEQGEKRTPKIFASRTAPSTADKQISQALREEQAKKEERLRSLASGKPANGKPATPLQPTASQSSSTVTTTQKSRAPPAGTSPSRAVAPASNASALAVPSAVSPQRTVSPAPSASTPASKPLGDTNRTASPGPASQVVRKRPAPSIFMPQKKRKV